MLNRLCKIVRVSAQPLLAKLWSLKVETDDVWLIWLIFNDWTLVKVINIEVF